jgi:3-deoxy-7-phosphoheptulonate synthase
LVGIGLKERGVLETTDDLRIVGLKELVHPDELSAQVVCSPKASDVVATTRGRLQNILHGHDDRLIVVIGPCSIHDPESALEYAGRLAQQRARLSDTLEIVMRVYFEKPRTTIGWKGFINDPYMNDTFEINEGLRLARTLLRDINELGLAAGTEFLDTITPQYISDLVAWGAIGARTTESQVHRQLASGLSCPVGFKNGTDGNVGIAVDAVKAALQPHHFLGVAKTGQSAILATTGNADCHIILRGGKVPNYGHAGVDAAASVLARAGLPQRLMIDASHGNSSKRHQNQIGVCSEIGMEISAGDARIIGVMVESHLVEGRQDHTIGKKLTYGQSVTDACISWEDSIDVLETLSAAVKERREKPATTPA